MPRIIRETLGFSGQEITLYRKRKEKGRENKERGSSTTVIEERAAAHETPNFGDLFWV